MRSNPLSPGRAGRVLTVLAGCLVAASAATAQSPADSAWNTIPLATGQGQIQARGTSLTVRKTNEVLFYSGILKRWTSIPITSNAIVTTHNAYAIVEDGTKVYGWSSRQGTVDTITVTATRKVIPGPLSANWVTIVHDGRKIWGFSGFRGRFVPLTVLKSTPAIAVGHVGAVVHDGVRAYGFGAGSGTWTTTTAPGTTTTAAAAGNVGILTDATRVFAFAAGADRWASTTLTSTANPIWGRGYVLWKNGNVVTAFSGHLGTFATHKASAVPSVNTGRHVAVVADGDTLACYAATQGVFRTVKLTGPTVQVNSELAILSSTTDKKVLGFSGVTGRFSPALSGTFTVSLNESVAYASATPFAYGYSPILDRWIKSPELSSSVSGVTMLRDAVVLKRSGGFTAFASREPRWVRLAASGSATLQLPRRGRGATLLVVDGAKLHAWDSKYARWVSVRTGTTRSFALYRLVALAEDGANAYGFSLFNNRWESVPLQEKVLAIVANSSIGFVQTTKHLHTYSAHGSFSRISRFPEFSRFQLRGRNMRLIQAAAGNSVAVTLLGSGPGSVATPLGTLHLDPFKPIFVLGARIVPSDGRLDYTIPIPGDPTLGGKALHLQNLIVPPSNRIYLTNSVVPVIS